MTFANYDYNKAIDEAKTYQEIIKKSKIPNDLVNTSKNIKTTNW